MQKQAEYLQAIKTKYPEQLVIAIARDKNGKPNPITLGWTMIVSHNPPMMAIAVANKRYSLEAINHSKCFTIAFPSTEMAEETLFFGTRSGRNTDKLAESNCPTLPAEKIDSVLLAGAVANFECTLQSQFQTGDHVTLIGKIVASHISTEPKKRLYTVATGHKLGPVT